MAVLFAEKHNRTSLSRAAREGRLRRVARGIYSDELAGKAHGYLGGGHSGFAVVILGIIPAPRAGMRRGGLGLER